MELGTGGNRLVEVDPRAVELLHLSAKLAHWFKEKPVGGGLCILNVKERQALVGQLAVELKQLLEGCSCLLLQLEVARVLRVVDLLVSVLLFAHCLFLKLYAAVNLIPFICLLKMLAS